MKNKVKLLIVDDHQMIIDGIKSVLYNSKLCLTIHESLNGTNAIALIQSNPIDIVLLDINLPDMCGIEVCRRIKKMQPCLKVLMISMYNEKHILSELLELGIDGYLLKNSGRKDIIKAIEKVAIGQSYFHPEVKCLLNEITRSAGNSKKIELPRLTEREKEILKLTAKGLSSKEIGESLHISQFTVEKHKRNMLIKFDLKNTVDLVSFGYRNKLIL